MIAFKILIGCAWCLAFGYVGGCLAARKGYSPHEAVLYTIIFGPFALAVYALLPMTEAGREQAEVERQIARDSMHRDRLKSCPNCGREVAFTCRICPRCEHRFVPNVME